MGTTSFDFHELQYKKMTAFPLSAKQFYQTQMLRRAQILLSLSLTQRADFVVALLLAQPIQLLHFRNRFIINYLLINFDLCRAPSVSIFIYYEYEEKQNDLLHIVHRPTI